MAAKEIVDTFGRVDCLINGAGGNSPKATTNPERSFFQLDEDGLRFVSDLNLLGTILPSQVFGRLMLANGVLLVRDMGMPNEYILPLRDSLNRGETLGPEMVTTGAILDGEPALIPLISQVISTPEAGREAVRKQAELGVNLIKVYSRLEGEGFLAIVDEARKCGLKAVGHIPESVSPQQATGGGLDSSEHFFGFEKAIGELLGEKVTYFYNGMGSQAGFLEQIGQVNQEELEDLYKQVADSGMTVCPTVITFKVGTGIKDFQAGNFPRQVGYGC